jgi:hypothetical protein
MTLFLGFNTAFLSHARISLFYSGRAGASAGGIPRLFVKGRLLEISGRVCLTVANFLFFIIYIYHRWATKTQLPLLLRTPPCWISCAHSPTETSLAATASPPTPLGKGERGISPHPLTIFQFRHLLMRRRRRSPSGRAGRDTSVGGRRGRARLVALGIYKRIKIRQRD